MTQPHPVMYYNSPGSANGRHLIQPSQSEVAVALRYEPKKKGLLWYRTYLVDFRGDYSLQNPTQITQTIYVRFEFPATDASYSDFSFLIDGVPATGNNKTAEGITEAVTLQPTKPKFTWPTDRAAPNDGVTPLATRPGSGISVSP
jgi:hypothetical protein